MSNRIDWHDGIGFVEVTDSMGSDRSIVRAARLSYAGHNEDRTEEQDKKLLRYLFTHKHTSPFEMGKIQFHIKLPIFVMRQFVRHRMQNLNELSGRYKEMPDEFFLPKWTRRQGDSNKQASGGVFSDAESAYHNQWMEEVFRKCHETYRQLLSAGVSRELARIVLPLATYTEIVSAWDLNNLLKFFVLRIHPGAQKEIEDYAIAMLTLTLDKFPWCVELLLESNEYIRNKIGE